MSGYKMYKMYISFRLVQSNYSISQNDPKSTVVHSPSNTLLFVTMGAHFAAIHPNARTGCACTFLELLRST